MPRQIDYREFTFWDNKIEIRRMPNTFWPFRAFGKINLTFIEASPTKTKVKCEVITGNNLVPYFMTIQTLVVLLWSTAWALLGWRLDSLTRFGTPIGVLIVCTGISVFKIMSDRRSLIDYSDTIIRSIKE